MIEKKDSKTRITHNCLFFTDLYWSNNRSRNRKRHVHVVPWLIALFLARIEPLYIKYIKYILSVLSVFFHPHKKRNPQQLCSASSVAFFIYTKTLLFILTISSQLIWAVLSKHFHRYFLNFSWCRKLRKNGNTLERNMYTCTRCISWCGLKNHEEE